MKRRLVILLLIPPLVGGISYCAMTAGWFRPAPPVLHYPAHLDLGELAMGNVAVGHFSISNRGGSDLIVDDVRTNCSCSGIERMEDGRFVGVSSLRLKPGESADLVLRVAIRGVPAGLALYNRVAFQTNDPQQPTGRMEIVVRRVLGGLFVSPATMDFGAIPRGSTVRHLLDVRDASVKPRVLRGVTTTPTDRVTVRLLPGENVSGQRERAAKDAVIGRLEVLVDTARVGAVNGSIQVHLEGDDQPCDPVPVTGRVVESIEINPSVLVLPRQGSNGPVYSATVICRSNKGEPLTLTVDSVPAGLTAEILAEEDSTDRVVRIAWDRQRGIKPGGQREKVRFRAQAGAETAMLVLQVNLQP